MPSDTSLSIRDAEARDAEAIVRGNASLARETEERELETAVLRAGVDAVLDDPAKGRYWVAEDSGAVVGQLMVTREWSDWRNGSMWWIQSVYVDPGYRRRGVFSALYRHVEALARRTPDCCGLRLYVERHNQRAQRTYAALGMRNPGYLVMESSFERGASKPAQGGIDAE